MTRRIERGAGSRRRRHRRGTEGCSGAQQVAGFPAESGPRTHSPSSGRRDRPGRPGVQAGDRGLRSWRGRPGATSDPSEEREGRAPLRGLGELRPLEVGRQPPDLLPGVRHGGPACRDAGETADTSARRQQALRKDGPRGGTRLLPRRRHRPRAGGGVGPEAP